MKRIMYILLAVSLLLGLSACGNTLPEETTSSEETGYVARTKFSYPDEYSPSLAYSMENAVRDSNEYYNAICEAFPNRPVLAVINNSYFGGLYSVELNDALNVWLEENGYNFAVMIYSFGIKNMREDGTFENKVKAFVDAGGKCDVIVTGANVSSFGIVPSDTIWDFVGDGLILPLDSVESADYSGVEQKYGKTFVERNTFNGKVYGFSLSALDGAKNKAYLAVRNECLPLVEGKTGDELVEALLEDREFLEEAKVLAKTEYALGYDDSTAPPYILPELCFGEGFTSVNMLPLYIGQSSAEPRVIALWESPKFESTLKNLTEIERSGLSAFNSGERTFSAAISFYYDFADAEVAQENFNAKAEMATKFEYTLIPLGGVTEAAGTECAMFLSACSENKEAAVRFILSALTDEGLGSALVNGVEGYSYSVENGKFDVLSFDSETWIYPNNIYRRDEFENVEAIFGYYEELQGTGEVELYENFCADLSENYDEATALVNWYGYYIKASVNISDFGDHSREDLEFSNTIPVDDLFADPKYPNIDDLKADIEAQLTEYLAAQK